MVSADERAVHFKVGPHPLGGAPRGTLWHVLAHFAMEPEITERVNLDPSVEGPDDFAIAERLMNVFLGMLYFQERTLPLDEKAASGIWEMSKHAFHGDLYRFAATSDVAGLAAYMRNAMRETVTHGLGPGLQVFKSMEGGGEGLEANVLIILDRLVSLAEALGVLSYENPEQGRYGDNMKFDCTELVAKIENHLKYPIGRPPVMGAFGIEVGNQIIDARVPDDVYSAERIKTLMGIFTPGGHVAEIGGGLGGCAVQAMRAGIESYTIFDLPVVLLVQGWLLMKIFGGESISMFGEPDRNRKIKLRPYWEFYDKTQPFDFVFNRDSMPEIPQQHADAYIAEIAERGCTFLSINQESQGHTDRMDVRQLWVHQMVAAEPRLRCIARHPYWTRVGYVEEFFIPTKS